MLKGELTFASAQPSMEVGDLIAVEGVRYRVTKVISRTNIEVKLHKTVWMRVTEWLSSLFDRIRRFLRWFR